MLLELMCIKLVLVAYNDFLEKYHEYVCLRFVEVCSRFGLHFRQIVLYFLFSFSKILVWVGERTQGLLATSQLGTAHFAFARRALRLHEWPC